MVVVVHGFCLLGEEQGRCSIFTLLVCIPVYASGAMHRSPALTHTISTARMPLGYPYVTRLLVLVIVTCSCVRYERPCEL